MTLFPYCTDIYAFRHPVHLQPTKMDHCPLLFFGANKIGSVHVYGKKTHDKWTIKVTPAPQWQESRPCVFCHAQPASSTANCKASTYSADNFWLTYL